MMSLAVERGIEKAVGPTELEVTPASLKMIKTSTSRPQPWGNQCDVYKALQRGSTVVILNYFNIKVERKTIIKHHCCFFSVAYNQITA